jgi:hypothetical protein
VDIATVNISTVVVNRDYRNARIANSVTVTRRDTFGTGRRTPVRVTGNPFETSRRHRDVRIVPPHERPQRHIVIAPPEARQRTERMIQERERIGRDTTATIPPATVPRQRRPSIQSGGDAGSPAAGSAAQARQLPPERVRRNKTEELKSQRPVVKQPEGSVFQSKQPDNLAVTRSKQPRVIIRKPQTGTSQQKDEQSRTRKSPEERQRKAQ